MSRSLTRIKSQGGSGTFTFKEKKSVSLHAISNSGRYRFSRFLSSIVHSANIVVNAVSGRFQEVKNNRWSRSLTRGGRLREFPNVFLDLTRKIVFFFCFEQVVAYGR